jgi:cytochrome P450
VNVLTVTTFDDAKEIYRHKDFKQALYDAGEVVMDGVLVNLHGDEHRARRRLENRLFRRETLVHYERDLFPQVIQETLAPHVASGRAELVELSHQLMMNLAALNAGVDRPLKTKEETDSLYGFMMKFIEGATLAHTTRDPQEVTREVEGAKSEFNVQFLAPSIKRRQQLIAAAATDESVELPKDILTELLKNEDSLHLPDEIILKEIAFFLLAGAHTSATAFVRTLDNLFNWLDKHPEDRSLVKTDRSFVQRAMFETIRLLFLYPSQGDELNGQSH